MSPEEVRQVIYARALLEKQLHLEHGWFDGERELQSWLFEQLIHKCEIIKGEPL